MSRLSALVGALRAAWTGEEFDCPGLGLHAVRVTPTPAHPIPIWLGGYAAAAVARAGRLADGHLVGRGEPHIVDAASAQLAAVRDPADPAFTRGVNLACVLNDDGGASARPAVRPPAARLRGDPGRPGRVRRSRRGPAGPTDRRYVQVAGDADAVVAGLRAVLARLRDWADVHIVLRVLFPEPDLDVQLARLATFGRGDPAPPAEE